MVKAVKIAKGKIEPFPFDKQGDHKMPCAICRESENLMKITGEQSLCTMCGNEVVICRGCLLKAIKKDLKATIKKNKSQEEKLLDIFEELEKQKIEEDMDKYNKAIKQELKDDNGQGHN